MTSASPYYSEGTEGRLLSHCKKRPGKLSRTPNTPSFSPVFKHKQWQHDFPIGWGHAGEGPWSHFTIKLHSPTFAEECARNLPNLLKVGFFCRHSSFVHVGVCDHGLRYSERERGAWSLLPSFLPSLPPSLPHSFHRRQCQQGQGGPRMAAAEGHAIYRIRLKGFS